MGLSQALATAISGLRTTQAGLSLVASNVANAQTPGYIRKTITQVTTSAGDVGVGVRASAVTRQLDQFVQKQLMTETSGASYADLRAQFYDRLQQVYGTPGGDDSIETIFNNFTTALQALGTNPGDFSSRTSVLSAAQILAGQLNYMTGQVQGLRSDAEQGLADSVNRANNAMQQIAALNQQLQSSSADDTTAATLEDQRDSYIQQLSQLMDIRTVVGDHNQVNVFTATGMQLVGTSAARIDFNAQGTITPNAQWNADPSKSGVGTLTLVSPGGTPYDMIANKTIRSGQIAAYLEMRDQTLVQAQSQLDGMAAAMAQALSSKTTDGSPAGVLPQTGFDVDIGNVLNGNTINVTYTDSLTGTPHKLSIVRVDDPSVLPLPDSTTTDPNDKVIGVDFTGGITSVISQLNAKFGGKLQFSTTGGNTLRILDDGGVGTTDVTAASTTVTETALDGGTTSLAFFTDADNPYSGAITSSGSQSVGFAGRISVNSALMADPSKLVVYDAGVQAGDITRPNFLYDQMVNAPLNYSPASGIGTVASPFSGSISSYLAQVIGQQGEAASSADSLKQGQDVVLNSLQARFDEQSGVSIDQEMANLLNLQNAYAANARIMSSVKDMFDTLMQIIP